MDVKKVLGENIKRHRKYKGMTQNELAEAVGISSNHLSKIEMGIRFISPEILDKLSSTLNVSVAALFFDSSDLKMDIASTVGIVDEIIIRELNKTLYSIRQEIHDRIK